MIDIASADSILRIPFDEPERLFSRPENIKSEFRKLAQMWHPDRRIGDAKAADVFAYINRLHLRAKEKADAGTWSTPGEIVIKDAAGKSWRIPFRRRHPFELGEMLYGPKVVVFLIKPEFSALCDQGLTAIKGFTFAGPEMEKEVRKYLPEIRASFKAADGSSVLVVPKTPDVYLLRDVIDNQGGKIEPRHAAWMISSLLNIACYLEYAGITHNAISLDTCFVSPEFHAILLLGGWWYSAKDGSPIKYLPSFAHKAAPPDIIRRKVADGRLDRTLIRTVGRQLLGDDTGMMLTANGVPDAMADFLKQSVGPDARSDYAAWGNVLTSSFGPRRFVKLDIPASAIFTN